MRKFICAWTDKVSPVLSFNFGSQSQLPLLLLTPNEDAFYFIDCGVGLHLRNDARGLLLVNYLSAVYKYPNADRSITVPSPICTRRNVIPLSFPLCEGLSQAEIPGSLEGGSLEKRGTSALSGSKFTKPHIFIHRVDVSTTKPLFLNPLSHPSFSSPFQHKDFLPRVFPREEEGPCCCRSSFE
jgi:hypothetical protein